MKYTLILIISLQFVNCKAQKTYLKDLARQDSLFSIMKIYIDSAIYYKDNNNQDGFLYYYYKVRPLHELLMQLQIKIKAETGKKTKESI
jgi:hypothetical protein